jgi:hypothetical protein
VAIRLHALPTLVFADFGLTTLFKITHGKLVSIFGVNGLGPRFR